MTVLDLQVSAGGDDGYWTQGNSSLLGSDSFLDVGYVSTFLLSRNSFMRFPGVSVANGMVIDVAYVRLRASINTSATVVNVAWSAIAADNAAVPTTYAEAEGATRTTASVAQNNLPAWVANTDYNSSSIISVVQEVVNRGGWASGNALVIYCEDNNSTQASSRVRRAYSYEGSTLYAPRLHIEYSPPPNTAPTITVAPAVSYGSLTRLGPANTPAAVSFTASDPEQATADALSYTIRTAASGGGTLVGSGTCTSGTSKQHSIANADPGLVDGSQTLYLRVFDGTMWSADSSFTLLRDTGAPTVGPISHSPNPVTS